MQEDLRLVLGQKVFGSNFVKLSDLFPDDSKRTDVQCRERLINAL